MNHFKHFRHRKIAILINFFYTLNNIYRKGDDSGAWRIFSEHILIVTLVFTIVNFSVERVFFL